MLLLLGVLQQNWERADPRKAVTQWLKIKADKANSLTLTHTDMPLISQEPDTDYTTHSFVMTRIT